MGKKRKNPSSKTNTSPTKPQESHTQPSNPDIRQSPPESKSTDTIIIPEKPTEEEAEKSINEQFETHYLRLLTSEFADDIEKLRNAKDFKEESVDMLVQALKQGAGGFSEREKTVVLGRDGKKGE